jgi:hypothetical protein
MLTYIFNSGCLNILNGFYNCKFSGDLILKSSCVVSCGVLGCDVMRSCRQFKGTYRLLL